MLCEKRKTLNSIEIKQGKEDLRDEEDTSSIEADTNKGNTRRGH